MAANQPDLACMNIVLAPMEGLMDFYLRQLITDIGGFDLAISEFIRVVDRPLPDHVFHQCAPELEHQAQTRSGTPVRIQLLGSDPEALLANARTALRLGSNGIDLNFGCPSKTVNKSCGGAVLLREPERIYQIVRHLREGLPDQTLTAKIRLGYDDTSLAIENASAINDAGADALTVHARTKKQGYQPPAHWHWIDRIRKVVSIPVTANGDIFSVDDYWRCREISGCDDVMIGRGAIYQPDLARQIKAALASTEYQPLSWYQIKPRVLTFFDSMSEQVQPRYLGGRLKQWLKFLAQHYPEAGTLFDSIKTEHRPDLLRASLTSN